MPLEETTPDGLFDEMGVQTFRVRDEPDELYAFETFAVTDEEVVPVGSGAGGPGITAFTIADADGDGRADLLYVSGSGRSIKSYDAGSIDRPGFTKYDRLNAPLRDRHTVATAAASPRRRPELPRSDRASAFANRLRALRCGTRPGRFDWAGSCCGPTGLISSEPTDCRVR